MKSSIFALSSLLSTALAQTSYFGVISARSASPIHFLPLTASGGKFVLGGTPSAYCPGNLGNGICEHYPGNSTTLAGGDGYLSLGVVVPGGQRVYVAPDGALSYTQAHSAYIPTGSVTDGWTRTFNQNTQIGQLSFTGGLVACPVTEGQPWQVYGQIADFKAPVEGCLGFSALTANSSEAAAWQY